MKILIIGFAKLKYMPYLEFHLSKYDKKENEILKLLGLTEKQMRGIRAYRKLPEERLDTVMSILIEAMNRTKISFGNERNLFIQTMAKLITL